MLQNLQHWVLQGFVRPSYSLASGRQQVPTIWITLAANGHASTRFNKQTRFMRKAFQSMHMVVLCRFLNHISIGATPAVSAPIP